MKLYRLPGTDPVTYRIDFDTLEGPRSATLSGHIIFQRALIDGLLWWAFGRMLEAFVAQAVQPYAADATESEDMLYKGERFVHTSPWQETENDATKRITAAIQRILPELAPLTELGPDPAKRQREYLALTTFASALRNGGTLSSDGNCWVMAGLTVQVFTELAPAA